MGMAATVLYPTDSVPAPPADYPLCGISDADRQVNRRVASTNTSQLAECTSVANTAFSHSTGLVIIAWSVLCGVLGISMLV
jgi:hypothetical protein